MLQGSSTLNEHRKILKFYKYQQQFLKNYAVLHSYFAYIIAYYRTPA
jgi:hypothetical protein